MDRRRGRLKRTAAVGRFETLLPLSARSPPWHDSALGPAAGDGRLWLQIAITWAAARDVYVATASFSSCNDNRVALPPAAVVSIESVRSVAKRCR